MNETAALDRRRFPRIELRGRAGVATLGFRAGRRVHDLLDFSPGGAALSLDAAALCTHDEPLSLRVLDREVPCRLARAPARRFGAAAGGGRLGLELSFEREHLETVAEAYHRLRFPSLGRRAAVPASSLRELFADSGYLALRPGLEPDPVWLGAAWPGALSHEAVFRDESGRLLGHIAVTRAYENAWLGHEIATLRDSPASARCRRDLYQHFCVWPRLLDGENTHVFGYYNPERRFHQKMFAGFAQQSSAEDCVIVPLDRYMPTVDREPDRKGDEELAIALEPLGPVHEAEVLDLLGRHFPLLARRAFDLQAGRLRQELLHPSYASAGIRRGRQCLVLRSGRAVLGAILCEWDDARLSLFDVLSTVHVALAPSPAADEHVVREVGRAVRAFYRARGAEVPLLTCPPGTFRGQALPGYAWAETMASIVFSARGLRAFERYVERMLSSEAGGPA